MYVKYPNLIYAKKKDNNCVAKQTNQIKLQPSNFNIRLKCIYTLVTLVLIIDFYNGNNVQQDFLKKDMQETIRLQLYSSLNTFRELKEESPASCEQRITVQVGTN